MIIIFLIFSSFENSKIKKSILEINVSLQARFIKFDLSSVKFEDIVK